MEFAKIPQTIVQPHLANALEDGDPVSEQVKAENALNLRRFGNVRTPADTEREDAHALQAESAQRSAGLNKALTSIEMLGSVSDRYALGVSRSDMRDKHTIS